MKKALCLNHDDYERKSFRSPKDKRPDRENFAGTHRSRQLKTGTPTGNIPNYELEFQKDFGLKLCNVVQASGFPAVGFKFIDPKSENPAGTKNYKVIATKVEPKLGVAVGTAGQTAGFCMKDVSLQQ